MDRPKTHPFITFEDYVFKLIEEKKTDTEEFKRLIRIYGRAKLELIWKRYVELKSSVK